MMATSKLTFLLFLAFIALESNAQRLSTDFYRNTCPTLGTIVNQTTARFISRAPSLAPALLRMHFHDCFVRVRPFLG